ncbi:ubiquinone/menaquinone biosynthesis C-methylase UbiE [Agrobacterium vitis]|nr:ubiquinone/menaquinone biosynthesis C-methylase UbiE [Agrobacterium vitis]MBE1439824.1 ubiquinone/menaquinone biosynthesis C-methylase UbiE [Agrobacterium vitis]
MSQVANQHNYNLKDEIKAYWSARAETFDTQPGHEIFSEEERKAWHRLISRHLGAGEGRKVLDLASGTGVVSHLLDDLGFAVTGMDWAEPMLERARAKAKSRGRSIRFLMGDAENTMEPDASYDVITNRHLVWTLVNPLAAFKEWHRVLKDGGKVLIVDGDFVNPSPISKFTGVLAAWLSRFGLGPSRPHHGPAAALVETHKSILSRVYFSDGARADAVVALLKQAGFSSVTVDTDLRAINRAQRANFGFLKGLERATQHRYAICAVK